MSVLIRGMEMPKSCTRCIFSGWSNLYQFYICHLQKDDPVLYDRKFTNSTAVVMGGRADNCPLIELPPHGRLIDADKAAEKVWELMRFPSNLANAQWFENTLRDMPTIIPAEKEKES